MAGIGPAGSFIDQYGRVLSPWVVPGQYEVWGYANQTQASAPAPAATAASTGVNPTETSYSLFGHTIPVSVFGVGRIGGEIIAGPYINGGFATFCISFGFPADPSGTRDIREIAFDSEVVWDTAGASGVTTAAGGTFRTEAFTFRFYQGTLTQAADSVEIAHWGVDALAYRPQILIWFEDLPIANTKFGKIPYVSAVLGDGTGNDVNLGEAFERLAASPFVEFPEFETVGITDGVTDGGLIFAEPSEFLGTIQRFGRFYPKWDILQTDKLRISDRGSDLTPDIFLDKSNLIGVPTVIRSEPNSVASTLELSTIDPDADYTIVPSRAQRPRAPVAVTTSVKTETAYLPIIMDAATRTSIVTYAKYNEETTRKKISFKVMARGLEIEPGALVGLDLGEDFNNEVYRIVETTHGADYTVECMGEAVLRCDLGAGCDEYTAFIDRTTGISVARKDAYRQLICGLVTDGVWDKLEVLHVYATEDATTALLNLKSTSYTGVKHGTPTFTVDRGFTGVAGSSSVFIDTGFTPMAGVYAQNSAHMSLWSVTDVGPVAYAPMGNTDAATIFWNSTITPMYSDAKFYGRVNSSAGAASAGVTVADPVGYYLINRSSSVQTDGYKDGASLFSQSVASASPNNKIYTLAYNSGSTAAGSPHQLAMASIGSSLSPTDVSNMYARLRTYMTSAGVP